MTVPICRGKDEWWCNWYECPECHIMTSIARQFSYCPECGAKIDWEFPRSKSLEEENERLTKSYHDYTLSHIPLKDRFTAGLSFQTHLINELREELAEYKDRCAVLTTFQCTVDALEAENARLQTQASEGTDPCLTCDNNEKPASCLTADCCHHENFMFRFLLDACQTANLKLSGKTFDDMEYQRGLEEGRNEVLDGVFQINGPSRAISLLRAKYAAKRLKDDSEYHDAAIIALKEGDKG